MHIYSVYICLKYIFSTLELFVLVKWPREMVGKFGGINGADANITGLCVSNSTIGAKPVN